MQNNFGVLDRFAVGISHNGQVHGRSFLFGCRVFFPGKRSQGQNNHKQASKGQALDIHGWPYFTANPASLPDLPPEEERRAKICMSGRCAGVSASAKSSVLLLW